GQLRHGRTNLRQQIAGDGVVRKQAHVFRAKIHDSREHTVLLNLLTVHSYLTFCLYGFRLPGHRVVECFTKAGRTVLPSRLCFTRCLMQPAYPQQEMKAVDVFQRVTVLSAWEWQ